MLRPIGRTHFFAMDTDIGQCPNQLTRRKERLRLDFAAQRLHSSPALRRQIAAGGVWEKCDCRYTNCAVQNGQRCVGEESPRPVETTARDRYVPMILYKCADGANRCGMPAVALGPSRSDESMRGVPPQIGLESYTEWNVSWTEWNVSWTVA